MPQLISARIAAQLHAGAIPLIGRTEAAVSADLSARIVAVRAAPAVRLLAERLAEVPGIATAEVAGPGFVNVRLDSAAQGELARTIEQVGELDSMLGELKLDRVIELTVDVDEVVQRLVKRAAEQGRADDTEDVIRNRFKVYRDETAPLLARVGIRLQLQSGPSAQTR